MAEPETFTEEQAQKLFNEIYPANNVEAAPTPAVVDTPEPVVPAEPDKPVVVETVKSADVDKPAETVPPAKTEEEQPKVANDPYAWVESITDADLKQKVLGEITARSNFEHQFKSNNGRIYALQQKLLEAERRAVPASKKTADSQPSPADAKPATPEGWQSLAKTDPELAQAIEARIKSEVDAAVSSTKEQIQGLKTQAIEPLYAHERERYAETQRTLLRQQVPNIDQVVASPEYTYWLNHVASDGVKQLAVNSLDVNDAIFVLRKYADDMVQMGYVKPAPQQPSVPDKPVDTTEADRIAAARTAKANAPAVVPNNPPITPAATPNTNGPMKMEDAEALFNAEMKKLLAKRT